MKSSKNLRCGVAAAMFAALTCVLTMFIKIPIMGGQGYIHPGDMAIYLAASILPLPFAAAGAAIGGALADILGGAAVWAPWTLFIKAALTVFFTRKKSTVVCGRNIAACAAAAVVTVGGYYVAEGFIYGSWTTPLLSVPWNAAQAVSSAAIYIALGFAFDRLRLKNRFALEK